MGFFSRDNQDNNSGNDFLDEVDLPSSNDLNEDVFSNRDAPLNLGESGGSKPAQREAISRSNLAYGIEDAIKLMRSLPRDNNEVVVTVVKKTLESTQIEVSDIIADADAKEGRIRDEHKTLETEIKELQEQIAQRNQQITNLLKDLKETTDVRQRLQLALDLDRQAAPKEQAAPTETAQDANNSAAKPPSQGDDTHAQADTAKPNPGNGSDPAAYPGGARRRAAQRGANP